MSRLATEVKPKSNRILLIFGVFLAIVAFGGALLVGRTSGGNIAVGGSKNVPAVVALKDIPASTQITADMVSVQQFSSDQAPPYAFRAKDLVVGKFAAIPIHTGSAIIDYDVVSDVSGVQPAKQAFLPIPAGMVAVQIPTGELVGVGGYIQPDDRIDVIVSYAPKGAQQALTKVSFTNLHVIRVGPAGGANTRGISSTLTVIVTLKQAEDLKWALDNTNYKFVLKSVKDYDVPDPDSTATSMDSFTSTYRIR
ncbi:MAG: Flp pilus assembly protein CpaB [Chloroflexi bacterium]|nr:MAG: Flp pilus assembly protein CpaB [Chloroflexota bacterium]